MRGKTGKLIRTRAGTVQTGYDPKTEGFVMAHIAIAGTIHYDSPWQKLAIR